MGTPMASSMHPEIGVAMSMTPRGWTINALATELERDRRTIAKKLAHVRPIEIRGRNNYSRLPETGV